MIENIFNNLTIIIVTSILYVLISKTVNSIILIKFPDLKNVYAVKIDDLEQRIQKLELKSVYERTKQKNYVFWKFLQERWVWYIKVVK